MHWGTAQGTCASNDYSCTLCCRGSAGGSAPGGCVVRVRIMTSSAQDMASGAESQMTSRSTIRTVHPTTDETSCPPASPSRSSGLWGHPLPIPSIRKLTVPRKVAQNDSTSIITFCRRAYVGYGTESTQLKHLWTREVFLHRGAAQTAAGSSTAHRAGCVVAPACSPSQQTGASQ